MSYGECKCNQCEECITHINRTQGIYYKSQKYHHSVLTISQDISSTVSGSSDVLLSDNKLKAAVEWLEWRVNHSWDPCNNIAWANYEQHVRNLALEAIAIYYRIGGV